MTTAGLLILGIIAGVLSGLFGIGGGMVMVPSLIAFFGLSILDANATSLAAMLLPVGILGVITYYKAGYINIRNSLWISAGLVVGSFFGAECAVLVKESILAKFYAALLFYIAFSYLDIPSYFQKEKKLLTPSDPSRHLNLWGLIAVGIAAGIIAGLFGKGGGIIIVPAMVKFFKYDAKAAAATSLAALQLPVGFPSVMVYAENGHLNILNAALIAGGIVLGAFLGTKLAVKMPSSFFKKMYAVFLLIVALYMAFKYA
jgi:uncharacterized membrane protein YfcA